VRQCGTLISTSDKQDNTTQLLKSPKIIMLDIGQSDGT